MTLFKQVALVVSLVFMLIVVTTTVGDFRRSSSFFEGQMQSTAQDMTTTLGIAMSNSSSDADLVAYETLFNAVFDSGYYSSIELVSPDGKMLLKKVRLLEIQGVPNWFISLVPIWPATGETQVMQGWVPLGTLRLTLHPGYVYHSLYQNITATLLWFAMLFSFGMTVLWLLLHHLLKPLKQVKQQADAIHQNKFVLQPSLPRTVELRSVVVAMNRMVEKVHGVFDDQEATLARYQKLLYEDSLTGMGNRKFFMTELKRTQSEEALSYENMVVIKILHLEQVYESFGYKKSEAVVKALANILKEDADNHAGEQCARLADDDFALLVPAGEQSIVEHVEDIFMRFKENADVAEIQDAVSLTSGISSVHDGNSMGEILAESDFALIQAIESGPYSIKEKKSTDIVLPQGKLQWRSWLERCISEDKLFLVRQKVLDPDGLPIHQEIFVRLKNDNGDTVPAGMFIPMANALNLGEEIDRTVFKLVKDLSTKQSDIPLAINLSASIIGHADALAEFNPLLRFFQHSSAELCVEASHAIFEEYPVMYAEVAETDRFVDAELYNFSSAIHVPEGETVSRLKNAQRLAFLRFYMRPHQLALLASTNALVFRDSTWDLMRRAIPIHPRNPMSMMTLRMVGPRTAVSTIRKGRPGMVRRMSLTLIRSSSTQPPM